MKAVAKHAVLLATLLAATFANAQSVRIGTLTYQPGQNGTSGYNVVLDATWAAQFGALVMYVNGVHQASGPVSTPIDLLYMGGGDPAIFQWPLPSCVDGCVSISLQLLSPDGQAMTITRWDGRKFRTYGANTVTMSAQPGQVSIVPGQAVGIYLTRLRNTWGQ